MLSVRQVIAGLLAVNAVLAVGVALRVAPSNKAYGQIAPKGELVTVAATMRGLGTVCQLNTATGVLTVYTPDAIGKRIVVTARTNVNGDLGLVKP